MSISDMVIHIQPELPPETRSTIENLVSSREGIVAAHFSREHPHLLNVQYDPDAVGSTDVLSEVRQRDPQATLIGGI